MKTGGEKTLARLSGCSINSTADQAIIDGLLSDTTWLVVLKKVNKVYSLYKSCQASEWKSKAELENNGNGLVPFCIWEGIQSSGLAYTPLDPPFIAGGTDGLSSSLEDIATDVYNLPSSVEGFVLSGRDYFLYEIFCDHDTWSTTKRLAVIIIALKNSEATSWKNQAAHALFNSMFDDSEFVKAFFGPIEIPDRARCEDESFKANYESIKEGIDFIYLLVTDWETFFATGNKIWKALKAQFIDMWGDVDGFEPEERYYHGYYGSKAAFEILGSVKKFLKFGKLSEWVADNIGDISGNGQSGFRKIFRKRQLDRFKKKKPYTDWDDKKRLNFESDFEGNDDFADWILKNQDKVNIWEGLINRPKWIRTNSGLLKKLEGKGDDFVAKVDGFYKSTSHKLPGGWKNDPDLKLPKDYQGIEFNRYGFPNFKGSQVAVPKSKVEIDMKGNHNGGLTGDYGKARKALEDELKLTDPNATVSPGSPFEITYNGSKSEPMTWHHMEDGKTMQAVNTTIHNKVTGKHTGGVAFTKPTSSYSQLKDFFNDQ